MSAHEIVSGYQWLVSTLTGDSQLRTLAPGGVWRGLAKPGSATPYIILSFQSGGDVVTMNAFHLMDDMLYLVKAVGPASSSSQIASAAARINDLIGGPTSGIAPGSIISAAYRQSPFSQEELVSGELWSSFGGIYRIIVQQVV